MSSPETDRRFEQFKKFQEYKKDLEKRLEEHLQKHPESPAPKSTALALFRSITWGWKTLPGTMPPPDPDEAIIFRSADLEMTTKVKESEIHRGIWYVWVNDALDSQFSGPFARTQATTVARLLSEGRNVPVGSACIVCGRRSGHRPGCSWSDYGRA